MNKLIMDLGHIGLSTIRTFLLKGAVYIGRELGRGKLGASLIKTPP